MKAQQQAIHRKVISRLPTDAGDFGIAYFSNNQDNKEHLALLLGDVAGEEDVLVRVHSECFTGDTLGSRRCDCNAQLQQSKQRIAEEGNGVLVYLRQEGRGIGLLNKLHAYNLQDQGLDTVDANLELGRDADEREYSIAGEILKNLGVKSVRLLTNNPEKIQGLEQAGMPVTERIPLETSITEENHRYLKTKRDKLNHLLEVRSNGDKEEVRVRAVLELIQDFLKGHLTPTGRPTVSLSYAQSLDGSISFEADKQLTISCRESMTLTHGLRTIHDAILIGIGTVLSDDPQLTARYYEGANPRPVIVDSHLKTPIDAQLLANPPVQPIIAATEVAPESNRKALEQAGAEVMIFPADQEGRVDLRALLRELLTLNIHNLMVEGGARIITSFLTGQLADFMILTVAPHLLGGLRGVRNLNLPNPVNRPHLDDLHHRQVGQDLVVWGKLRWGGYESV